MKWRASIKIKDGEIRDIVDATFMGNDLWWEEILKLDGDVVVASSGGHWFRVEIDDSEVDDDYRPV